MDVTVLGDRGHSVILTLATTVLCPLNVLRAIHFSDISPRNQKKHMAVLSRLLLGERTRVKMQLPGLDRTGVLESLTHAGWRLAGSLGAVVPQPAMRDEPARLQVQCPWWPVHTP